LYIPANPFYALANNLVPAVVLFSIAIGVVLIGVRNEDSVLNGMNILIDSLMRVANFIVKLAPIGVFAITASASGTMYLYARSGVGEGRRGSDRDYGCSLDIRLYQGYSKASYFGDM
jgi:L-cystine uptake protein TcyP (sodium:dicarboxylate symporter family)